MQGDFTRDTFSPLKHFRRVLMQQGRVMLDADFNEQAAIVLHYLQTLATDMIGWHGGPAGAFAIGPGQVNNFPIGRGHYYVEGVLSDNEAAPGAPGLTYLTQPYLEPLPEEQLDELAGANPLLVYLDAWERHISYVEDAVLDRPTIPGIREVALGGPDTASRTQLVWQVKCVPITGAAPTAEDLRALATAKDFRDLLLGNRVDWKRLDRETHNVRPGSGRLRARTYRGPQPASTDPCITPPNAGYRGNDNRLYRVEIHRSDDTTAGGPNPVTPTGATFKWSRENGSVIFPLRAPLAGDIALVRSLGRDDRSGLQKGDWVEILDDDLVLRNQRGPICRVEDIDLQARRVQLRLPMPKDPSRTAGGDLTKHPFLRRWDHRPNQAQPTAANLDPDDQALKVVVSSGEEHGWLTLEDGVQVQFEPGGVYLSGDYWLIPARVATGNVEWPLDAAGVPVFLRAHGVRHYYAPLAIVTGVNPVAVADCRRKFKTFWE